MPLPAETLAALFEASPNPYIIVAPDLTIAGANAAYMKATNKRPEELTGRYLFDAFPGSLESQLLLKDSFATVLANKEPHAVPLMRYDVPASSGTAPRNGIGAPSTFRSSTKTATSRSSCIM